jgi:GTPase SAR1 family protein
MTTYFRNISGVAVLFDVADPISFRKARGWLDDVMAHRPDYCRVVLVGSKSDLRLEPPADGDKQQQQHKLVAKEEALALAKEYQVPYYEVSAKTGEGVEEMFREWYRDAYKTLVEMGKYDVMTLHKNYNSANQKPTTPPQSSGPLGWLKRLLGWK